MKTTDYNGLAFEIKPNNGERIFGISEAAPEIPPKAKTAAGVADPVISLNSGEGGAAWRFLFESPSEVPQPGEACQDFDFGAWRGKGWAGVTVPGELVMQGFDIRNNTEYYYQREFTVPADYAGSRALIRFDGVYTYARVWVNGKYIRTHRGGFTTWDCDITGLALAGQAATLTIGVADVEGTAKGTWNPSGVHMHEPSFASGYAYHNIGGILRDVALMALNRNHVARLYVETAFDENFTDARLRVAARLGMDTKAEKAALEIEVFKKGWGDIIAEGRMEFHNAGDGKSNICETVIPVKSPAKWDAEHPSLYTLRLAVTADGETKQVCEQNLGFRELSFGGSLRPGMDKNKLYVNGSPVRMRGVCRHDVSYDMGRSCTREQIYREMLDYKNCNINMVRTSHYPAPEALLDACDEIGIYVEQENAVCWQGQFIWKISPKGDIINPQKEIIERDKNHACVLFWSAGNESLFRLNPEFAEAIEYAVNNDRRPAFLSASNYGGELAKSNSGVISMHYMNGWEDIPRSDEMPVFLDEYFGNAYRFIWADVVRDWNVINFCSQRLHNYWENIYNTDGNLGGAAWASPDDIFYASKTPSVIHGLKFTPGIALGEGPWGLVHDVFKRLKPEALSTKKAYSPIRLDEKNATVIGGTLSIPVENRFDHTDFSEIRVEYSADGGEPATASPPDIAPRGKGAICITGAWGGVKNVNVKFYTAFDGIMIDEYNIRLAAQDYRPSRPSGAAPAIEDGAGELAVSGGNFRIVFDKAAGLIKEARCGGELLITGGPYFHTWPEMSYNWIPSPGRGVTAAIEGGEAVVTLAGEYAGGQGVEFTLRISGNGIMTTSYVLTTAPALEKGFKEVGLGFGLPDNVESVSWVRDGFHSAYPADHIGRNEGTAFKKRENADACPDRYGIKPGWAWKDDMADFFLHAPDDPNAGAATRDFNTQRDNIWRYGVNFCGAKGRVVAESVNAGHSARIDDRILTDAAETVYFMETEYACKYMNSFTGTLKEREAKLYAEKGDFYEFKFYGTGIRVSTSYELGNNMMEAILDGQSHGLINMRGPGGKKKGVVYEINNLEERVHSFRLVVADGDTSVINFITCQSSYEILHGGKEGEHVNRLVVNGQRFYPCFDGGNYEEPSCEIYKGYADTVTIRLCGGDD